MKEEAKAFIFFHWNLLSVRLFPVIFVTVLIVKFCCPLLYLYEIQIKKKFTPEYVQQHYLNFNPPPPPRKCWQCVHGADEGFGLCWRPYGILQGLFHSVWDQIRIIIFFFLWATVYWPLLSLWPRDYCLPALLPMKELKDQSFKRLKLT